MTCHHTAAVTLFIVDVYPRTFEMRVDSDINSSLAQDLNLDLEAFSEQYLFDHIWDPFFCILDEVHFVLFFQPIFSNIYVPNWVFLLQCLF